MARPTTDDLLRQARRAFESRLLADTDMFCHQILGQEPRNTAALNLLSQVAFARGLYDDAVTHLSRCAAMHPRDAGTQYSLGELYTYLGRYRDAITRFDKALRLKPDDPMAVTGKASAYVKSGEHAKARALLQPFVDTPAMTAEMAMPLARVELHDGNVEAIMELVNRHATPGQSGGSASRHLYWMLGRVLEQSGRYDEAFGAYRQANKCVEIPFDTDAWLRHSDDLIEAFSAERMRSLPRARHGSSMPIFIVGMPRCGSTLVETILDTHPDAHGAGELATLPLIVNDIPLQIGSSLGYPACIEDFSQEDVDAIARTYLDRIEPLAKGAQRVADKYLGNYRYLGLIELLFPEARIIHCRRDPLDTCLSCFCQTLLVGAFPFVTDLQRLGIAYTDYQRAMTHWQQVLQKPILEVQYEQLVSDQQRVSREIVEFCGLPWDDSCLRFYERSRAVQTASFEQVTKPIYSSSVARYQNFEKHLGPLKAALGG
jgi:tetratricopeptide (TPR) repeat protein